MDTTVLYHGNCPDGFGAALACWQHFGNKAQYIPVQYGQSPPEIPIEHRIMIVDFSYPEDILLAWLAERIHQNATQEPYVVVLDHHASAQRDLEPLMRGTYHGLHVHFDMEESGATLAWKWLYLRAVQHQRPDLTKNEVTVYQAHAEQVLPPFFAYLRDRDLWHWRLPESKEVSYALASYPQDFHTWQVFCDHDGIDLLKEEGAAIRRYVDQQVMIQAARATMGTIGGYVVPIVNTTTLFSEVGDYLCTYGTALCVEPLFCAYYFDRADGKRQWGLRGHGKVDVSVVAKMYGGGGHPNAAGFTTAQGWLPLAQVDACVGQ